MTTGCVSKPQSIGQRIKPYIDETVADMPLFAILPLFAIDVVVLQISTVISVFEDLGERKVSEPVCA